MAKDGKLLRLRLSRLLKEGDGLFCLPLGFRDALLDISERLTWAKTWETDSGEQAELTDEQWQLIENGIWRLTDMCEIIINNIVDVPTPVVNITNNISNSGGGGGDCCSDFPNDPNDPNPLVPLDPNDPFGETVPEWDEETETPPPGYDDWESFVSDRCRAANWFVDSYIQLVKELDMVERQWSIGNSILEIAALLLALLPGPIGDWAGAAVIIKWVAAAVSALADIVEDLEQINDWLQTSVDEIKAHKEELVCAAYRMSTVEYLKEFFLTFFAGYIDPALTAEQASPVVVEFFRKVLNAPIEGLASKLASGFANQNIPEDYVPTINCDNCGSDPIALNGGWFLFPAHIETISNENDPAGVTDSSPSFEGNTLTFDSVAPAGNLDNGLATVFSLAYPPGSIQLYGFYITRERLNGSTANFRHLRYDVVGSTPIWSGPTITIADTEELQIRSNEAGVEFVTANPEFPTHSSLHVFNGHVHNGETYSHRLVGRSTEAGPINQKQSLWMVGRYL